MRFRLNLRQALGWRETRTWTPDAAERRQVRVLGVISVGLALALWAILAVRPPSLVGVVAGHPSPVSIQASHTVTYVSQWRTEQERARAESSPDTVVYTRDPTIPIQQRAELSGLLQTITQIRNDPTLNKAAERERLTSLPNSTLVISPGLAMRISRLTEDEWDTVRRQSLDLYDRGLNAYDYSLSDAMIAQLRDFSLPYWSSLMAREEQREIILLFSRSFLKSNRVVDETATRQRKQEARAAVEPIKVQIQQGESIVREGDPVTPDVLEKLEALGELRAGTNWLDIGGRGIMALLVAGLFGLYLRICQQEVWSANRPLLVVVGLFLLTALAARLAMPLGNSWSYAFPLAITALLLVALFNNALAIVTSALLSLLVVFLGDNQLSTAMVLVLGSMAGIFALRRADRTLAFMLAGVAVTVVTALAQLGFWLVTTSTPQIGDALPIVLFSAMNGAISAIVSLGLYNVLGQVAGIVTPIRLMELAHPANPLLRKLIREAPGTYYHSVSVGNLAESAAEAIGADALLLRVASYYHDIGKTVRPYFFTDNQSDRENVHNELDPRTSAEIIADHVREGVKMARAAGLPRQIVEFISAHHGTSVIQHFYQMALQKEDMVDVQDYRYPGPRPRTREQGIMMLADTVEATVRSKFQHGKVVSSREDARPQNGQQTLEELVAAIVDERVRSGQLDESSLTLKDLARIRQAFVTTLQGIYHPRVDYTPQLVKIS